METTGFKDKNGRDIKIGDMVLLSGNFYDVILNDFNNLPVVDSDLGQSFLMYVHNMCEVQ